ncbi:hypothetical protein [Rubritalea tangerina]
MSTAKPSSPTPPQQRNNPPNPLGGLHYRPGGLRLVPNHSYGMPWAVTLS